MAAENNMEREYAPEVRFDQDTKMGGLTLFGLESVLSTSGVTNYKVATLPFPRTDEELEKALSILNNRNIKDAYVDKGKLVFIQIPGQLDMPWQGYLTESGITSLHGKNSAKRRKMFNRPVEMGIHLDSDEIGVTVWELEDIIANSPYDLSSYTDDEIMRICDGNLVISRHLWDRLVESGSHHTDKVRQVHQEMRLRNMHEVNVRATLDEFLKGDAVPYNGTMPGEHHIITTRDNLKDTLITSKSEGHMMIAQPMKGSNDANLNIQANIWFNATARGEVQLFPDDMWRKIVRDYFEKAMKEIAAGTFTERFFDVESSIYGQMRDIEDAAVQDSFTKMRRWNVIEWAMLGGDFRTSPTLLQGVAKGYTDNLLDRNGHPRLPMPNTCFKAIKSVTMLKMAGFDIYVEPGHIEYHAPLDVWVISDTDWIDDYFDFGTHDGDDKWMIMSVNLLKEKGTQHKILAWRLPMDSYVVFDTNSKGVPYKWADGTKTWAFDMNGSVKSLPKPLSKRRDMGMVTLTGFPSEDIKPSYTMTQVTREQIADEIIANYGAPNSLGLWVNSLFLYRLTFGQFPTEMIGLISDVVDTSDPQDKVAVNAEAVRWIEEVCLSGLPIPGSYFLAPARVRGFRNIVEKVLELDWTSLNIDTNDKLSRQRRIFDEEMDRFNKAVYDFGQTHHATISHLINELVFQDRRLVVKAERATRRFRGSIFNLDRSLRDQAMTDPDLNVREMFGNLWYTLLEPTINEVESLQGTERDLYVLALYTQGAILPTSTGKYNDNLVMTTSMDRLTDPNNPREVTMFHHLVTALQNFGFLANDLNLVNGKLKRDFKRPTVKLECSDPECEVSFVTRDKKMIKRFQDNPFCKAHK